MTANGTRLTILVDNYADENLVAEHGFSVWVDTGTHRILFDTGQLGALEANAATLNIPLETADMLVLSHGHYDHTGNLPFFLSKNDHATLFMGERADLDRFSCKPGTDPRAIGIPEASRQCLLALPPERLRIIDKPTHIAPGIGLTGPVPRDTSFEDTGGPFFLDDASREADLIEDDQSMWFETPEGLVVLLGCCHAGIVNTIQYIRQISGISKLRGIIGGMHLVNADQHRLDHTFAAMQNWEPDFLVPCHCTGDDAAQKMLLAIGSQRVHKGQAGRVVVI